MEPVDQEISEAFPKASLPQALLADHALMILAVNLTRRCNMRCAHCYLDAGTRLDGGADELVTAEVCDLLDEVASLKAGTMVVLTGGEPLLRRDLEEIAAHGAGVGLPMVVGTNGILLTDRRVHSLMEAGISGAGISLDSLQPDRHDEFRGCPGAWQKTLDGIDACRRNGLLFQLHFSVTDSNAHELDEMASFALSVGAKVLNVFFLVCTGRGQSFGGISAERYEAVLARVLKLQAEYPRLIIRPRCAPHYKRIAYQDNPEWTLNRISGQSGDGCIAGTHYCRVTPEGGVTLCPYIEEEVGSIRTHPFADIWETASPFEAMRAPTLKGRCGTCEFGKICGGCRARPLAEGRGLMDEDSLCRYQPPGVPVIEPLGTTPNSNISWTLQAEARLSRVPQFLRKMLRTRAEAFAAEKSSRWVRTSHLKELSARRFGDAPPWAAQP